MKKKIMMLVTVVMLACLCCCKKDGKADKKTDSKPTVAGQEQGVTGGADKNTPAPEVSGEYFKINDISVSELKFNYYKTNVENAYAQYFPYIGVDTSKPFSEQIYDEETGMSWEDFFIWQAAESLRQNIALAEEAAAKGITIDVEDDYKNYMDALDSYAAAEGIAADDYLADMFGEGATVEALEPIVKEEIAAFAYYTHLTEITSVTEEEVTNEYNTNRNYYDSVDYHMLDISAGLSEGATEEEIETAMAVAEQKAREMLDKVKAGEDFRQLCLTYASEETRQYYEDTEVDNSFCLGVGMMMAPYPIADWLFHADRKPGESDVIVSKENQTCFVVKFEKRYQRENALEEIKTSLTEQAVFDYVEELMKKYTLNDPEGKVKYQPKE